VAVADEGVVAVDAGCWQCGRRGDGGGWPHGENRNRARAAPATQTSCIAIQFVTFLCVLSVSAPSARVTPDDCAEGRRYREFSAIFGRNPNRATPGTAKAQRRKGGRKEFELFERILFASSFASLRLCGFSRIRTVETCRQSKLSHLVFANCLHAGSSDSAGPDSARALTIRAGAFA
jgi:hypothetical protein